MLAILHIEPFVTFDFDPFRILRQITDSDLGRIKCIIRLILTDDWATELYETTEIFYLTLKIENPTGVFLFLSGIAFT